MTLKTAVHSNRNKFRQQLRLYTDIYVLSPQVICQEKEGDELYTDFIAGIIEILYATEEGFGPAEDEVEGEPEIEDDEQEEY